MASTKGLVPITRSFLSRYYDKYPFNPLCDDVSRLTSELRAMAEDLQREFSPTPSNFFFSSVEKLHFSAFFFVLCLVIKFPSLVEVVSICSIRV